MIKVYGSEFISLKHMEDELEAGRFCRLENQPAKSYEQVKMSIVKPTYVNVKNVSST